MWYDILVSLSVIISFYFSSMTIVSHGQIVITQSTASLAASPWEKVTITYTASSPVSASRFHWYQQKPEASRMLLVYDTSSLAPGVLVCFSWSGSETSFSLTISNMEAEVFSNYYCQQWNSDRSIVGQTTTKIPLAPQGPDAVSSEFMIWLEALHEVGTPNSFLVEPRTFGFL